MARTRLFLGVDVSPEIRRAAGDVQAELARTGAAVKWVEEANMHITLVFLGDVDDRELVQVCRIAQRIAAGHAPFGLTVAGLGAFPTPRRPKVLWGGITDGLNQLVQLHTELVDPLIDLGCYRREERGYSPHLTLGRTDSVEDSNILAAELPKYLTWTAGQTLVNEVLVYSSELRRNGPEYTVLGRAPLA